MTELIRHFPRTLMELGVEQHGDDVNGSWFVVDRRRGEHVWHTHCGPYSTRDQAVEWIMAIRETYHAVLGPVANR